MNASEILELVRAGYTRAEIDAMNADPEPAHDEPNPDPAHDEPNPDPAHDEPEPETAPAWVQTLNNTLADLRKTIQASNIRGDDMGDELDAIDAAELAAAKYLTGKEPEVKSKGGNKKK